MQILKHPLIIKFREENNLAEQDLYGFIGEIKLFLSNPDLYQLNWQGMVEITTKKVSKNPGVYYLEEEVFNKNITIEQIDYQSNVIKRDALSKITQTDNGVYLFGTNGVGKTFMAIALANLTYNKYQEQTLYVFWPDFIEKTKRFNNNNNAHYINKVKYAKRLIIDDLGQESISQWSRDDILNAIIAFRLEKGLYTIVTSNYTKQELLGMYTLKANEAKKARAIISKLDALAADTPLDGKNLRN